MTAGPEGGLVVDQLLESARRVLHGLATRKPEAGAGAGDDDGPGQRMVGVGWATVDVDRVAAQFSASLGLPASAWLPAQRDALLGASTLLGPAIGPDGPRLILLEPDTEGRAAASLARLGEGVAVVYVAGSGSKTSSWHVEEGATRVGSTGPAVGARAPGPLGLARLVLGGPAWGPHVIVVDAHPESLPSASD